MRFRELKGTAQQQQMKSVISQLPRSRSRQLGHADKRRIDIGSDTRVAAVHIMSLSGGGCEGGTLSDTVTCFFSFLQLHAE